LYTNNNRQKDVCRCMILMAEYVSSKVSTSTLDPIFALKTPFSLCSKFHSSITLCDQCLLGRFLLCRQTKETNLALWHHKLTVNTIQRQWQTDVWRYTAQLYCHLNPTAVQHQIPLYHTQRDRYLYTCYKQNTNSWQTVLEEAQ
jgi:hypothetical protein